MALATINLSSLNGTNGFTLNGIYVEGHSGFSVSSAGDINGDGFDDLIIGAPSYAGASFVVFGSSNGFSATFDLSSLNGSNGFILHGIDYSDLLGFSVSSAGDINGDGLDDLIIGGYRANVNGNTWAGESYVVFGSSNGFSATFDHSSLNGSNGFTLNGIDADDFSGFSVSSAGDINGDGFDDLIIGAMGADPNDNSYAGESYVVFGNSNRFSATFDLSTLNGTNGFTINGIDAGDYSGSSVSSAGDINGDGIDDLIIGAWGADPNSIDRAGESYVVFGNSSGFSSTFDLSTLNGNNGFTINGIDAYVLSGFSVSSAGDINGDGIDDLIIGAPSPWLSDSAGESDVVFGSSNGFSATLNLSTLNGSNGFVINGDFWDFSGSSVSSAGDINGDGFDDLIIAALWANLNGSYAGKSYVVFGFDSTLPTVNLSADQTVVEGLNNPQTVTYTVTLSDISAETVTVNYATVNGTAVAGSDYSSTTGTLSFAPGETSKTITIPILNDSLNEPDETFNLNLSNPVNAFLGHTTAITTITDTLTSDVTTTLPANVENLLLTGTANINGTGNIGSNILTGNTGNNRLDGGAGADTMDGSTGNDTYLVDNVNDTMISMGLIV